MGVVERTCWRQPMKAEPFNFELCLVVATFLSKCRRRFWHLPSATPTFPALFVQLQEVGVLPPQIK
eukprot:CAMPEP_0206505242 /NCGR_PEP_ID=MMETSP0324_2-20121206/56006_1 /ASSEMBLY_ACC=CAM_ASM_000836 /TAXON_ID=2866 /ORGANISM="Crypthecodinium cohnii, Strain Seligo" /LENGTH=65 /DNA_ID=CAMNT_0053994649 /DNA_START=88 /DNA_END=285 /DNA_ORIENTATION=-